MSFTAISIRQPWAFLIVQPCEPRVRKDIENRSWQLPAQYVGQPILVQASAKPMFSVADMEGIFSAMSPRCADLGLPAYRLMGAYLEAPGAIDSARSGGIVGVVRFAASIRNEGQTPPSPWADAESKWWWPVMAARPLPFTPCKGRLSFFKAEYPHVEALEGF